MESSTSYRIFLSLSILFFFSLVITPTFSLFSSKTLSGSPTCSGEFHTCFGCGNGVCDYPAENCNSCPVDCGLCAPCDTNRCGNGRCEANETACNCAEDCGSCCVDRVCREDRGESYENCASDCAVSLNISVVDSVNFQGLDRARVYCHTSHETLGPAWTALGNLTFNQISPGGFNCYVSKPGYADNNVRLTLSSSSTNVWAIVPLTPEYASITGYVRNALTGQPLPNAWISCNNGSLNVNAQKTDNFGGFFLTDLPAGTWSCNGTLEGYSFTITSGNAPPGGHVQLDLWVLPLSTALIGWIKNTLTGAPVPGAIVTCRQSSGWVPFNQTDNCVTEETVADNNGYYFLDNINPGQLLCTAKSDGYDSQTQQITVYSNTRATLNFTLRGEEASIWGVVIDTLTDQGVVTANITCTSTIYNKKYVASTIANFLTNGTYSLPNLVPGYWTCTASALGWTTKVFPAWVRAGVSVYLPFALDPLPSTIQGQVTSNEGKPIAYGIVVCNFTDNPILPNGIAKQPNLGPEFTDAQGNFQFSYILIQSPLLDLRYTCTAVHNNYGIGVFGGSLYRGEVDDVPIVISSAGLSAVVVNADGSGVLGGATINCTNVLTGSSVIGTTDPRGTFNFAALPLAKYSCSASAGGFTSDSKIVDLTSDISGAVTFFINPARITVTGMVTLGNDTAIETATVTIRDATNTIDLFRATLNATGYFAFQVSPGSYFLFVENGLGFTTVATPFTVYEYYPPPFLAVSIKASGGSIQGNLRSERRPSINEIPVDLYSPDGEFITSVLTDEQGDFLFENVESEGVYIIKVPSYGRSTRSESDDFNPSMEFQVEVEQLGTVTETFLDV